MTSSADWIGKVGDVWAAEWQRTDRSFADLSRHLDVAIGDAAPRNARVLDIGCGAGATSIELATRRPDVMITGLDLSAGLIDVARTRSARLDNIDVVIGDLTTTLAELPMMDLFFSRHGVMFFDDPIRTFTVLKNAGKPNAALVFSCFRSASLNPWASELVAEITVGTAPAQTAMSSSYAAGPFGFADPDVVQRILTDAGWRDIHHESVDFRYVAGAGDDPVADALSFFRRIGPIAGALRLADDAARPAMLDKLAIALQKHREQDEVAFPAAAWIWRARAPGEQS